MARPKTTKEERTVKPKSLASYQSEIVCAPWTETLPSGAERARIDTFVKSRRVGGSVAAAYRAALWAAGLELQENRQAIGHEPVDVVVVSKDFVSAKRLLREVGDALADLGRAGPEFAADVQATSIKMRNGRVIEAVSCSDKAIRGNTAACICDEFAFWRQQEACWAAVKSVTDPTYKYPAGLPALFITTAWESGSLAHRIFTDEAFPFHRHSVDIYQAVEAGFPIDIDRAFAELGIPELIDSEYKCLWSKGGSSFFAMEKLLACQVDDIRERGEEQRSGLPEDWELAPARFGIDCGGGRGRDFTAVVQWRLIKGIWWMVGVKASNILGTDDMADDAADWILGIPGQVPVEVRADQGIMGLDFIRRLSKRLKDRPNKTIDGVSMMPLDQERFAVSGRRLLERRQMKIYSGVDAGGDENGARALMLELSQLKSRPGTGGRLTFATPRDPTKGHLDRAWAALIGLDEADEEAGFGLLPIPDAFDRAALNRWSDFGGDGSGRGFG